MSIKKFEKPYPVRYALLASETPVCTIYIAARCYVLEQKTDYYNNLFYTVLFPLIVRRPYSDRNFRNEANVYQKTDTALRLFTSFEQAKLFANKINQKQFNALNNASRKIFCYYLPKLIKLEGKIEEFNSNDPDLSIQNVSDPD